MNRARSQLMKGMARFAWEELKTMNREKLSALGKILSGYLRMRFEKAGSSKGSVSQPQ